MKRINILFVITIVTLMVIISCGDNTSDPDTEMPSVSIIYPVDNEILASNTNITITIEAQDNDEIDYVELYIDSILIITDAEIPYQYDWDTTDMLGEYSIFAKAYDSSNNSAISDIITVTIFTLTKLFISPPESFISIDEEVDLSIQVENIDELFGFSAEIVFDYSVVEPLQDLQTIGSLWGINAVELIVLEEGRINIAISLQQTPEIDKISGSGELISLRLKGLDTGISNLNFENVQMLDENGNTISNFDDIEITNGEITIE